MNRNEWGTHFLESIDKPTSQATKTIREKKGHSLPEKRRDQQVKTWDKSERAKGTHFLESADGPTSQDTETNQASEWHSLPEKHTQTDQVRTRKQSE